MVDGETYEQARARALEALKAMGESDESRAAALDAVMDMVIARLGELDLVRKKLFSR